MREECEEQTDLTVWVNKDERIVTFRDMDRFAKITFQSQEEKWHISTTCVKQATGFGEEVHRGIIRCIILYPVLRSSCKEHCAVF